MKLIVPYLSELRPEDKRLVALAEFLGVNCHTIRLERGHTDPCAYIKGMLSDNNCCFVINPIVMKTWLCTETFPVKLASYLTSSLPFLFVHGLYSCPITNSIVYEISEGRFTSVRPIARSGLSYEVTAKCSELCGVFSNLVFGPVNMENDSILVTNTNNHDAQTFIAVGGETLFGSVSNRNCQVFFLGTKDIMGLDTEVEDLRVADYFSRLIPPVMLFRYTFGQTCWHPIRHLATLIIDDPILNKTYGYMNFGCVLRLMEAYRFHTSIAFIPYNHRRNSTVVTEMFRTNSNRYSLCFHGNDHTAAEFAAKDVKHLNSLLIAATTRMVKHEQFSGIRCDKIMVFPQGKFSVSAMEALKQNNFLAAVNTEACPFGESSPLRIVDMIQPALMKYCGFPLFLRKYVDDFMSSDIAFYLFFGKPVLIVEHHSIFKDAERIVELVKRINSMNSDVQWANLQTSVQNSLLQRFRPCGSWDILAYSPSGVVENTSDASRHYSVIQHASNLQPADQVLLNGKSLPWTAINNDRIRFSFDLKPEQRAEFAIVRRNSIGLTCSPKKFTYILNSFFRRRLSEMRDNYVSTNPALLSTAEFVKKLL